MLIDTLGLFGGALATFCLVPQLMRVFKLRSAGQISLLFNTALLVGQVCWLVYGIYLGLGPVILWNSIGTILVAILLYAKLKYGRQA